MNYLISAYSVNPYKGSEDGIGWNWVLQHEKNWKQGDRIILITKKFNELDTRKGFEEYGIKHIELVIVDVPNILNWFKEKHSMFHHMYYILWQHWAWKWVKNSKIDFDIIHHVTMNDYRIVSKMYKCESAKVIWGPVGGAQVTPRSLKCYEKSVFSSKFREAVNKSCNVNPMYRYALSKYYKIYCINNETKKQLEQITRKEIELLPELALRQENKNLPFSKRSNTVCKIVFVGRLIGKKGVDFLIDVLSSMQTELEWHLDIYGDGVERKNIEEKIKKSNISKQVNIWGSIPLNQIDKAYKEADIFVLPSLRETSGNVLLEAMAHAVPIVAFDTSFCSTLKDYECGIFVNVNQNLVNIKKDFAEAIIKLLKDKELRTTLGKNGYYYVNKNLTWENKFKHIYSDIER